MSKITREQKDKTTPPKNQKNNKETKLTAGYLQEEAAQLCGERNLEL